ncbi:hypothetical protein ARMGADRAFT_331599 [Armillaria gallica]|uniref:Uncharacterized protein n=1 Tax=Armillaria gallica TaxID=47427 RepID=A0A2H3D355_ARMGA|nr:hypothetical protein ARMGADRAFT_331599 [Armillaria gallica]
MEKYSKSLPANYHSWGDLSEQNLCVHICLTELPFANRRQLSPLCQYSCEGGMATQWHIGHLGGIFTRGPGDTRYDYPPPARDFRRPPSPVTDYREYPPPPSRYDDYRRPPPMMERDRHLDRGRYPPEAAYRGPIPPPAYGYDRYDKKAERFSYPPPPSGRPRTSPRYREDFDRMPRDYPDYRGRPMTPSRFADYPRGATPETRFRRRSESPAGRYSGAYEYAPGPDGNYPATPPGPPPRREYPPRSREVVEVYRR